MSFSSAARHRALLLTTGALIGLTGCSQTVVPATVSPDSLADRVVSHVERTLALTAVVDCGGAEITVEDGSDVECRITDPETGETYDAIVRIIAPDGADYDIDLSVHQRAS